MSDLTSFRAVIELWPSRVSLARELGHADADTAWTVCGWWKRKRIPANWWAPISALPKAIENGVTVEHLAGLAAAAREREVA